LVIDHGEDTATWMFENIYFKVQMPEAEYCRSNMNDSTIK
jgi:hypothetical protein